MSDKKRIALETISEACETHGCTVIAAGFPWRWHERVPQWWLEQTNHGQLFLFEMSKYDAPGPLCQRCEWQGK